MKSKYKKNQHFEYYEGIIQLRPLNVEVYNWVVNNIENSGTKIAKEEITKNGFDIYVNSNQYVMGLGRKLKKRFGGVVKLSRTLHTMHKQTSKQLYRVTMSFRLDEKRDVDTQEIKEENSEIDER